MFVPKHHCAALMKSTLWSIDLACGLIDAVFKNSLVWGMGELQGSRRSCRAHLSMFTEPGAFIQQQEKRPDRGPPVPNESHCHCTRDAQKHTQSYNMRKKTNTLSVLMQLHVYPWILLMFLVWSISCLSVGLLLAASVEALTSSPVLHKSLILTDVTYIFIYRTWLFGCLPDSRVINQV